MAHNQTDSHGLNRFDIVYYINLEHRTDRKIHILNELSKTNIYSHKINRIDAVNIPEFGQLGCSLSHIKALELFLQTDENIQNCIIFEDDFEFTLPMDITNTLMDKFFEDIKDYNVLMLAYNLHNCEQTNFNYLIKILGSFTTSGYCVSKEYAKTLLNNYKEGAEKLEYNFKNFGNKVSDYYLDVYYQHLINHTLWYGIVPKIGKQTGSYSDIESKYVDYNV